MTAGTAGEDAWRRWSVRWDIGFAVALAGVILLVFVQDGSTTRERIIAASLLLAMAPWYALVGRGVLWVPERDTPRGILYILGLTALLVGAQLNVGASSFALCFLCAHSYWVLSVRWAVLSLLAYNAVPILTLGGQLSGTPAHIALILTITLITIGTSGLLASWITSVIAQSRERADLIRELEATRAELAASNRREGMRLERQRMAGEIHDTLAQGFTSILMLVRAADANLATADDLEPDLAEARRQLALVARTATENLAEARALIAAQPATALDAESLPEALRRILTQFGEESGIATGFTQTGDPRPLAPEAELTLVRATQEAIANVRKHAATARNLTLSVGFEQDAVRLSVTDDGPGFDPSAALPDRHFGLRGMRERAERVAGTITVESASGRGTTLTVEVPL